MDDITEIKAYGSHKDVGYTLVSLSLSLSHLKKSLEKIIISGNSQQLVLGAKNSKD